jgi:hypothetical protein
MNKIILKKRENWIYYFLLKVGNISTELDIYSYNKEEMRSKGQLISNELNIKFEEDK